MWYQENNNLIRAPVPPSFDTCLKNLEDNDSVLFESVSFPCIKPVQKNDPKRKVAPQISRPITPKDANANDSNEFISSDTNTFLTRQQNSIKQDELIQKIQFLEQSNQQKDLEIKRLQNEIIKLKRLKPIEKKKTELASNSEKMIIFYKTKYEQLKEQFEKFKENLASDGKIKKYRLKTAKELNLPINTLR